MMKEMTKSLPITKRMVFNSYLKVMEKDGAAGIDRETIELFNKDLRGNLYKIWNRMASGSYMPPPVRTVLIDKKGGGKRPLGIPTVSDRIAQGVIKDYLEPSIEAVFHHSSFGYRPKRSAHHALQQCHDNCMKYAWVVDVDIKGFFDNIDHDKLLLLLRRHTRESWVLMYVKRWLKAGVEQEDGSIAPRTKGTPQGGVISPLISNVFLHHVFDIWMEEEQAKCPFERYADDIVIHCRTKEEAVSMLERLCQRMNEFNLELHPEKTKIVYCKNYLRKEKHEHNSFVFLSYIFKPRTVRSKFMGGRRPVVFSPAICQMAKTHINTRIRSIFKPRQSNKSLEEFAEDLNPRIIGWWNYYAKFGKDELNGVFHRLNILIQRWIKNTYKIRYKNQLYLKYKQIVKENPEMFYHWKCKIVH